MVSPASRAHRRPVLAAAAAAAALAALSFPGCHGGGGGGGRLRLEAVLSGGQEVPAVATAATGTAVLSFELNETQLALTLVTSGIANVNAAHVHAGPAGVNGPVIFSLYAPADGPFPATLRKRLSAADLVPAPASGVATFADAIAALKRGDCYVNVHTRSHFGGEIRGQIGPARLVALLSGGQESPPVATVARGRATITLGERLTSLRVDVETESLAGVVAGHIHVGAPGTNGPVVLDLLGSGFSPAFSATVGPAELEPRPEIGVTSFADVVLAILEGRAYVNLHTSDNPGGEIRGHVGRADLAVVLGGRQEVPPVETLARGGASVRVGGTGERIDVSIGASGLVDVVAAHIHVGPPGVNGPVILDLLAAATGPFDGTLAATLTASHLVPRPADGIETFADAVEAVLSGRAYVNVHTAANPGGEIRGQVGRVILSSVLSGDQESPPVASTGFGLARLSFDGRLSSVVVALDTLGLADVTRAHVHFGRQGQIGPVILPLYESAEDGPFTGALEVTLGPGDLLPSTENLIETFEDAVNAILGGETYVNVHTTPNPGGEIRGHVGSATHTAELNGAQETPPVDTGASGAGSASLDGSQRRLLVTVETAGLVDVVAAHVHFGDPGVPGPVIFPLYDAAADGPFTGGLLVALDEADFQPAPGFGIDTFDEAIAAFLAGRTYLNVHTLANAAGEIRGQLVAP